MSELARLKAVAEENQGADAKTSELNAQAIKDLRFLCSRLGYNLLNNVNFCTLNNSSGKRVFDTIVMGYEKGGQRPTFKSELLTASDKMYVSVVLYEKGVVKDAYLFEGANFIKPGIMSKFKHDKKAGVCSVDVSGTKLEQYSFGYVIQNLK